jgi:uncharacterized BrkB/YihY/UPF0761 family membrane protein
VKAERGRAEDALRSRRQRSAIIDAGFEIQELDAHVGGGILAGAVAFRMFLFLVPFVYIVFTVFDDLAKAAGDNPHQVARSLGISGVLATAVVSATDLSAWSQLVLFVAVTIALVLTAKNLVKTLYAVHWLVWRMPRMKPRGYYPIAVVVGLALVIMVFAIITDHLRRMVGIAGIALVFVLITGTAFCLWWWVSWKLPHPPSSRRALIPGAVFMALGVEVLHLLTTYWIGSLVARRSHAYGAVGIALAVLFWVYILGRIVVGSAGVNATLWRRGNAETATESTPSAQPQTPPATHEVLGTEEPGGNDGGNERSTG